MYSIHKSRAQHLMSQMRYEPAILELQKHLGNIPDDPLAHGMLGVCHARLEKREDAIRWAERAVHLGPDIGYCHWARAFALRQSERYFEAEAAALEALRLTPSNPSYHSLLAQIRFNQRDWNGALEAAEAGMAINPSHSHSINIRALSLLRLGNKVSAQRAIHSALADNPEDPTTHANQGWICLGNGEHERALTHFKEALRINPNTQSATHGILEALASKYFAYRTVYHFYQWLERQKDDTRRVIAFFSLLSCCLLPLFTLGGPVRLIVLAYGSLLLLVWTGRSFFDLLLRFNPLGKLALTRQQIIASNWVGLCVPAIIVSTIIAFDGKWVPMIAAGCFGLLAVQGASIRRIKGSIRVKNTLCIFVYCTLIIAESLALITHNDTGWPLAVILIILFPAAAYMPATVNNRISV